MTDNHRRIMVILNPASGSGKGAVEGRQIVLHAKRLGLEVEIRETKRPGHEKQLAYDAVSQGWPVIAAAGGDGTLHGVANGILEHGDTDVALALVPIGTGNDYARTIGVPYHNVAKAMETLAGGVARRFDVGRSMGEYFVNAMGFGFGPAVVESMLDRASGTGLLPYLNAIVGTFWRFQAPYLEAVTADLALAEYVMMIEVTIGRTVGGGMTVSPDADPRDGLADICVIRKIGTFRFLRYLPRVIRGRHTDLPMVTMSRADHIEVRTAGEPAVVHMDGELRTSDGPAVEIDVLRERLPVICAV